MQCNIVYSYQKIFKPGYLVRPISDNELRYLQIKTGQIREPVNNSV